jgi:predicted nuclease of restriction endonuclease-like (RecB) superfamily
MTQSELTEKSYINWIAEVSKRFKSAQLKAAVKVNDEMLRFYFSLGKDINTRQHQNKYGSKFYEKVSKDLKKQMPDVESFSPANLRYMERFFNLYDSTLPIFPQLGEDLFFVPWGHQKLIIDKLHDSPEKAAFYIQKTVENGWSRAVLLNMIDTKLFESYGKAINNFDNTLPAVQSDLAKEIVKDPYNFDFLSIRENYKELELQNALEQNIYKYLVELGKGFAFVGRQVRIEVNGDEYFCDQLFYHTKLHCYIVVELKIVKFEPEFVSKLNFYCNAVNHLIKQPEDNDTIGLLICKEKNDLVAQWTVEKTKEPIAITKYELKNLLPIKNDKEAD